MEDDGFVDELAARRLARKLVKTSLRQASTDAGRLAGLKAALERAGAMLRPYVSQVIIVAADPQTELLSVNVAPNTAAGLAAAPGTLAAAIEKLTGPPRSAA